MRHYGHKRRSDLVLMAGKKPAIQASYLQLFHWCGINTNRFNPACWLGRPNFSASWTQALGTRLLCRITAGSIMLSILCFQLDRMQVASMRSTLTTHTRDLMTWCQLLGHFGGPQREL